METQEQDVQVKVTVPSYDEERKLIAQAAQISHEISIIQLCLRAAKGIDKLFITLGTYYAAYAKLCTDSNKVPKDPTVWLVEQFLNFRALADHCEGIPESFNLSKELHNFYIGSDFTTNMGSLARVIQRKGTTVSRMLNTLKKTLGEKTVESIVIEYHTNKDKKAKVA